MKTSKEYEIFQESNQQRRECSSQGYKNEKGDCITSRKGIADVFGEFYKRLCEDKEKDESEHELGEDDNYSSTDVHNNNTGETAGIPEITTEELQTAFNKLRKGKFPDSRGIRAEDIKACDDETREMVRQIFNEIIKRNEFTPEDWKKVRIKVIHKKGDVENVSNYRPICSLLALYKLFSTILYGVNVGPPQILQHRSRLHQPLEEDIQRPKRHLYRQTKRATFSSSEKEPSKMIRCPACCSTRFFNTH